MTRVASADEVFFNVGSLSAQLRAIESRLSANESKLEQTAARRQ